MSELIIDSLTEDDKFLIELDSNIWLMDNHRWAYYTWEKFRLKSDIPKFSLVHADYHWDGGNDFHSLPEKEQELLHGNLDSIFQLVHEGNWIRFDSFIAPAVIRGFLSEVHFYCNQDDSYDVGIEEGLLARMGTLQTIHDDVKTLSNHQFTHPVIFDLCLDLFNESDGWFDGDLWSESKIMQFLTSIKKTICEAELVTVSLSFGYSGTEDDTRWLAKLVIPTLENWRLHR